MQFGHGAVSFRQSVKGDARVQMVNMVIADIRCEPTHNRTGFHKAGRLHRRLFICRTRCIVESNAGKIVLSVKKVRPDSARNKNRNDQRQKQCRPAEEQRKEYSD